MNNKAIVNVEIWGLSITSCSANAIKIPLVIQNTPSDALYPLAAISSFTDILPSLLKNTTLLCYALQMIPRYTQCNYPVGDPNRCAFPSSYFLRD